MASIDEVARLAGVSTATVSRALSGRGHVSESARLRVQEAASALGYVVSSRASSLASGRTRNIGVVVPFLDRWFFSTVLSGVSSALMREGYQGLHTLRDAGGAKSWERRLLGQIAEATRLLKTSLTSTNRTNP